MILLAQTIPSWWWLQHVPAMVFVFCFGACVGSFLNVVIYRLPAGMSVISPPSRCPTCGATGPRDAVGAVNILSLGVHGAMLPGRALPQQVKYLRPWRSSSGGHPARSSA